MPPPKPIKIIAALNLPESVPRLIIQGNAIVAAMTGNAYFPSPTPPLAHVAARIAALQAAHTVVRTWKKGGAEMRQPKVRDVADALKALRDHVQRVADLDPKHAVEIIVSAGMSVKGSSAHKPKAPLTAKQGNLPGLVLLFAKAAAKRAAYQWQWSLDKETWISLPQTLQANTSVHGLTAGTMYYFRVCAITKTGAGRWSNSVSLLVG